MHVIGAREPAARPDPDRDRRTQEGRGAATSAVRYFGELPGEVRMT